MGYLFRRILLALGLIIFVAVLVWVIIYRKQPQKPPHPPAPTPETASKTGPPPTGSSEPAAPQSPAPARPVSYHTFKVQGAGSLAQLRSELGDDGMSMVLKINRVDRKHIRNGSTLVIPDSVDDFMALSPFPQGIELARPIPKLLLISRRVQAFGAYEAGELVRWGPTSTGRKSKPTPTGLYHMNWKTREKRSTVKHEWILRWYYNLENREGISIHQYDLPGRPASHACVRLLEDDAQWIYDWADGWTLSHNRRLILANGTPVIVFGEYDFDEPPPWKQLPEDPDATTVTMNEIEEALKPHLQTIQEQAGATQLVAR